MNVCVSRRRQALSVRTLKTSATVAAINMIQINLQTPKKIYICWYNRTIHKIQDKIGIYTGILH